MSKFLLVAAVFAAGMTQPAQAAMNARLKEATGSVPFAAAAALLVAGLLLGALAGVGGRPNLTATGAAAAPWWVWLAGLSAAALVSLTLVSVTQGGAASTIAAAVAGQAVAALLLDHFGWLEVTRTPANPWRVAGTALVVLGMLLVQKK